MATDEKVLIYLAAIRTNLRLNSYFIPGPAFSGTMQFLPLECIKSGLPLITNFFIRNYKEISRSKHLNF